MIAFLGRLLGQPRLHIHIDLWLVCFYLRIGADNIYAAEFVWLKVHIGIGQRPLIGLAVTRQVNDLQRHPRIGWPNHCMVWLPGWRRRFTVNRNRKWG